MPSAFPALSSPFQIGSVTIKNRIVQAPLTTGFYLGPNGEFTPQGIDYFVRRAQGGTGLLQTGALTTDTEVDPAGALGAAFRTNPLPFIVSSEQMLTRAHAYGSKFFIQLSMGLGRNYAGLYGPSENPVFGTTDVMNPVLTTEQIRRKISQLVESAVIAQKAGFDGLEVHAIHWGYLLDQLASSFTNRREDEYGGSLDNRLRAACEIVEGVKEACGQDWPVTIRLGLKAFVKGWNQGTLDGEGEVYRDLDEGIEICRILEAAGYDGLDVDTGTYDSFYYACPPMYLDRGYMVELAEKAKAAVSIPVIVGSRMGDPMIDERAIAQGKFDAVALGRPLLADPDFAAKIEAGTPERIRPCIACNQGCLYRLFQGLPSGCAVNPEVRHTADYAVQPAPVVKRVVVVGGGVAGMEAARVAALRGHEVILFEKSGRLGGHLIDGGAHDFKVEVRELNEWYVHELASLPVEVRLYTEATPETIRALAPDVVICALGSSAVMPHVDGIDHPKCLSCVDALNDESLVGHKVVVVGGGLVGCELSLDLINKGRDVTIVEALPQILSSGIGVPYPNVEYLQDAFAYHQTSVLTSTRISAVTDEGAVVEGPEGSLTLPADTVIIAVGFRPAPSIAEQVKGLGAQVFEIGDQKQVGNILTCIWDAYEVARTL